MAKFNKYIGLDVHKETIAVAIADGDGGEVRYLGEIVNQPTAVKRLLSKLSRAGERLRFCYEAGPCGAGVDGAARSGSNSGGDAVGRARRH